MNLHPTEILVLSTLSFNNFICKVANDPVLRHNLKELYEVFRNHYKLSSYNSFTNLIDNEEYRQFNIRVSRVKKDKVTLSKEQRLLNLANSLLFPPKIHITAPHDRYIDVRIIDKNIYGLASSTKPGPCKLIYRINNHLLTHEISKNVKTIEGAFKWIEPIEVRAARKGTLDGKKVRGILKDSVKKLFYVDIVGEGPSAFPWVKYIKRW